MNTDKEPGKEAVCNTTTIKGSSTESEDEEQ